ncbi:hypothetical protein GCM10027456_78550 [Kineosporia babensis]|uniref:Uncharacterized protein n=1 Tax=Kineosporia babensis TaxID=499548 RepID=A0A9X1NNA2_9ACTN|nr:hypothetical protein [Kineosporia babensis]MCD5316874.1 hypothetical protein [Kineosporia babensis]
MLVAQNLSQTGESLLVQGDSAIQGPCRGVGVGEVVGRSQGFGVLVAQDALLVGEGLFVQGDGSFQVSGRGVGVGEVVG